MQALSAALLGLALCAGFAAPTASTGKAIEWSPSYQEALELAAKEARVIFIAVNMDGERANDRMADQVYGDRTIVALSESSVNMPRAALTSSIAVASPLGRLSASTRGTAPDQASATEATRSS